MFEEHSIAKEINKDYEKVLKSQTLQDFAKRNEYKSQKQREADEQVVNFLLKRMRMYADGWISANVKSTSELYRKNELLDEMERKNISTKKELDEISHLLNDQINSFIRLLNDLGIVPEHKLVELREMEIQYRKLKQTNQL